MTYDELRIRYVDESLDYLIQNIQGVDPTTEKPAFSISPPGVPPEQNILLGTQGQTREYTIRFRAAAVGGDKANATHTESVETVEEQYTYLRDQFFEPGALAEYELYDVNGGYFAGENIYIERINTPFYQVENPRFPEWSFTIRVGSGV